MPKFQSTVNPKEIIEVSEERAEILRSPRQTGWKEYNEPDVPTNSQQSNAATPGKRGVKRGPKRVQQANRGVSKSD